MYTLMYTASISAGLAFVNSLPIYALDGDQALGAWLQLLRRRKPPDPALKNRILAAGTTLFVAAMCLSFKNTVA